MSEVSYAKLKEDIDTLTPIVQLAETSTTLDQFFKLKISREKAISEIYLENQKRPPSTKKENTKIKI